MGMIWAVLVAVGAAIGALTIAILSRLIADDAKAWLPVVCARLIDIACSKLPLEGRHRCREEWTAHIAEVPGDISKLVVCLGFLRASRAIRAMDKKVLGHRAGLASRSVGALLVFVMLPSIIVIIIVMLLSGQRKIFSRVKYEFGDGRHVSVLRFNTSIQSRSEYQGQIYDSSKSQRPIGRFLRRSSLDALPFLVDVTLGKVDIVSTGFLRRSILDAYQTITTLPSHLPEQPKRDFDE